MTKPVGQKSEDAVPTTPESKHGKLQEHEVLDQTGQTQSYAEKVPNINFKNPEGTFELTWGTIKTALLTGGVGYALNLILAYLFPTKFKSPIGVAQLDTQLVELSTKNKTIDDKEVQQVLGQMFHPVEALDAEWQKTKNKEEKIPSFLVQYEKKHGQISSISDTLPFVEQKKAAALQRMEAIKKEALGKVLPSPLETLKKQFDEAKQSRHDQPEKFLTFFDQLESKIAKLKTYDAANIGVLKSEKEKQLSELEALQTELKSESSKGRQEAQEALLKNLPNKDLQAFATATQLQMKNTFAESVISFKEELKKRHQIADQAVSRLRDSNSESERSIKNSQKEIEKDRENLKKMQASLQEIDGLKKRQNEIEEKLRYLYSIQAGEVKEKLVFTKEFTHEHKKQIDSYNHEFNIIAERIKQIEDLPSLEAAIETKSKALEKTQHELEIQENHFHSALDERRKVEKNSQRLDQILKSSSGKAEFKNYVKLLFLEGAFEAFQKNPVGQRLDSTTFLQTYKSNSANEINSRIKRGLEESLGYVPDALQEDAQIVIS